MLEAKCLITNEELLIQSENVNREKLSNLLSIQRYTTSEN